MGVKGLKKLLTSQSGGDGPASSYKEHGLMSILRPVNVNGIEKDIFLVVDASGYIISLIEQMMKDGELRLDLPSEYHKIEEKIVEDINDIGDSWGISHFVFFFDGKKTKFPKKREERERRIRDAWGELWAAVHSSKASKAYAANLADRRHHASYVFPVLMMEVLRQALRKLEMSGGLEVVECEYEADHHIAQYCAQKNRDCEVGQERAFILGGDSDFMVMRDCAYLWLNRGESSDPDYLPALLNVGGADGKLWRRRDTAASLGLSEFNFREFCIMLGNDYTNIYKWSDFDAIGGKTIPQTGSGEARTAALLEAFITAAGGRGGTDLVLVSSSTNTDLQYAIDFSRVMYELEDVDDPVRWPDHKDDTERRDAGEGAREVSLTREQKEHIRAWSHKQAALLGRSNVGNDIRAYLKEAVRKDGTYGGPAGDITEVHLRALEICMVLIPFVIQLGKDSRFWRALKHVEGELNEEGENYCGFYADRIAHQCQFYLDFLSSKPAEAKYGGENVHSVFVFLWQVHQAIYGPGGPGEHEEDWMEYNKSVRDPRSWLHDLDYPVSILEGYLPWPEDFGSTIAQVGFGDFALGNKPSDITWPTLRAGVMLEMIYREFISIKDETPAFSRREGVSYEYDITEENNSPSRFYHAQLFHIVVQQLEKEGYGLDAAGKPLAVFDDFLMNSGYDKKATEGRMLGGSSAAGSNSAGRALLGALKGETSTPAPAPLVLPIHAHKEQILTRIEQDRVVIIHGETGCGKSSGLPVMLLDDAASTNSRCKMMVSQPRRIAAASLADRLRTTHGDKIALRMGHGVRDETEGKAAVIFVTTGYLVRLLAHHPESFNTHTHLIIDEVHERSVDGDVLCMLARKLLEINPTIKIVLMSATIHTALYEEYFGPATNQGRLYGTLECLSVGARRFPVDIIHLEDLLSSGDKKKKMSDEGIVSLPQAKLGLVRKLVDALEKCKGNYDEDIKPEVAKLQYGIAEALVMSQVNRGTGVLIFVSGINDITEMMTLFDSNDDYILVAIHSDVPYEEQKVAMEATPDDKIKVIIATNAAESSITVPDCDTVICLGTHKALKYNAKTHRVALVNSWVSQASSTQRAGRTGRVRPGKVFRLYTADLFKGFDEHEPCEVQRVPGQDLILQLRTMFEESESFDGVVPILQSLLQPPDMNNVDRSFRVLFNSRMITELGDSGELTNVGRMAGALPVDLSLGKMVTLGVLLDIGVEAAVMAIALSQPKTLFRLGNPFIHKNPDELYYIYRHTFVGAMLLDDGAHSEPIMMLKLYLRWHQDGMRTASFEKRLKWGDYYGLVITRVKQFVSACDNMVVKLREALLEQYRKRSGGSYSPRRHNKEYEAALFPAFTVGALSERYPHAFLDPARLNRMRVVITWALRDNVMKQSEIPLDSRFKNVIRSDAKSLHTTVSIGVGEFSAKNIKALLPSQLYPQITEQGGLDQGVTYKHVMGETYNGKISSERHSSNATDCLLDVLAAFESGGSGDPLAIPPFICVDQSKSGREVLYIIDSERVAQEMSAVGLDKDIQRTGVQTAALTSNDGFEKADDDQNFVKWGLDAYYASKISKSSKKKLKAFCEAVPCSVLFTLPSSMAEEAILTARNCRIDAQALQTIFYCKDFDPDNAKNVKAKVAAKPPKAVKTGSRPVLNVETQVPRRYNLRCDEQGYEEEEEEEKGEVEEAEEQEEGGDKDKENDGNVMDQDTNLGSGALAALHEVPDGMLMEFPLSYRLLYSYQAGDTERDAMKKCIRVWKDQPDNSAAMDYHLLPKSRPRFRVPSSPQGQDKTSATSTPKVVVGSAAWQALKKAKNETREEAPDFDGQISFIHLDFPSRTWRPCYGTRSGKAIVNEKTYHGVSAHLGSGAFYAVGGSVLDIGRKADIFFVDQLTCLPPGNLWLNLVLSAEPCEDMAFKRSAFGSMATVKVNWDKDRHEDLGPTHSLRRVSSGLAECSEDEADELDNRVAFLSGVLGDILDQLLVSGRGVKSSALVVSYVDWLFARWADSAPSLSCRSYQAVAESRIKAANKGDANKSKLSKKAKRREELRTKKDMLKLMKNSAFHQELSAVDSAGREQIKTFLEQILEQIAVLDDEIDQINRMQEMHQIVVDYLMGKIHEKAEEEEKKMQSDVAAARAANASGPSNAVGGVKKSSSGSKLHQKLMRGKEKRLQEALTGLAVAAANDTDVELNAPSSSPSAEEEAKRQKKREKAKAKRKATKEKNKEATREREAENDSASHSDNDLASMDSLGEVEELLMNFAATDLAS